MTHPPRRPGRTGRAAGDQSAPRTGDVEVLRITDLDGDVVDEVNRTVAMAFADASRGLVVALPEADVQAVHAVQKAAAALVRDWPAVPVVLACPSEPVRQRLLEQPAARYVAVTATVPLALTSVLGSAAPALVTRNLSPHPTSPRAARDVVSRALLDWGLVERMPAAVLVVSELVTNAMVHTRTPIGLRVATHAGTVRVSVSDGVPDLTSATRPPAAGDRRAAGPGRVGRGLAVVAALSQRWGVLPTCDGGKAVWALLADGAGDGHSGTGGSGGEGVDTA